MKDTESAASFQSLLASVSFHGPARVRRSPPQLLGPRVTRGRGRDCRILCRGRDCRSRPTRPPRRRVAAPSLWSCPSRRSRPRACKRIGRRAKPGPGPRHCNTPRPGGVRPGELSGDGPPCSGRGRRACLESKAVFLAHRDREKLRAGSRCAGVRAACAHVVAQSCDYSIRDVDCFIIDC